MALTSDDPDFHKIIDGLGPVITDMARKAGKYVDLRHANSVLMVVRPDETAELWIDTAAVSLSAVIKRDVPAGSIVFESDLADVTEMRFPLVEIGPKDKLLYLFRQEWRFGLFFDFNPNGKMSVDEAAKALGALYRRLKYRHVYDLLENGAVFERLVQSGWFPFVEIIGAEFRALASACEAGFPLDEAETQLLRSFDDARLDRIFRRWTSKPHFKAKERILKSAIAAYKAQDPVAVLKIILTEIEGILAEAHSAATGKRAKLKSLLEFARQAAERKAGASDTLLFPVAFATYLESYTYANFDPKAQTGAAGSRHAVVHGAANANSYTQPRALQALLTLDQLAFYT